VEASFDTGPYAGVIKNSKEVDLSNPTEPAKADFGGGSLEAGHGGILNWLS